MKNIRDNDFSDRRNTAAGAKATLLRNFLETKEAAELTRPAREEERLAVARAREERRAERERARRDAEERVLQQIAERQAAAQAVAAAEVEAREGAENRRIARVIEDEAARKAKRDLRYANRKARRN